MTYDDWKVREPDLDPEGEHQDDYAACPDCGAVDDDPCLPECGCRVCRGRELDEREAKS